MFSSVDTSAHMKDLDPVSVIQMLRIEAKPEHTRQYLATQHMRHYRYPAA
jgi:hypothetical protein